MRRSNEIEDKFRGFTTQKPLTHKIRSASMAFFQIKIFQQGTKNLLAQKKICSKDHVIYASDFRSAGPECIPYFSWIKHTCSLIVEPRLFLSLSPRAYNLDLMG